MESIKMFLIFDVKRHTSTQCCLHKMASLSMLLLAEERAPCPHHLAVTPALWDVAAPLESDRVPIIYMP